MASSRRIPTGDGKIIGRMSSTTDPKLQALPEGHIDPMLKTITLARGEAPLVRMHYYATHPQSLYGDPRACSDVPGFARKRMEDKEGVFQIYFTGCDSDKTKRYIGSLKGEGWAVDTDNQDAGKTVTARRQSEVVIFFSAPDGSGYLTYEGAD